MENQHLGIANLPYQTWGELFTPEEALKIGTIFRELNKPFFSSDTTPDLSFGNVPSGSSPKTDLEYDRECLMTKINEVSFLLDDLTLYLDTHPEDQEALNLYKDFSIKRKEFKKKFAADFYPLTRDCILDCNVNDLLK